MRLTTVLFLLPALLAGSAPQPVPRLARDGLSLSKAAVRADGQATPAHGKPAGPSSHYTFASGVGMLFFHVKADRIAEFEAVIARIRQVLDTTTDPARRQQADGWRIYKSVETSSGPVYVFMFDPATAAADYDPIKLLGEASPVEAAGLYAQLKDATVKVERMGLTKVR